MMPSLSVCVASKVPDSNSFSMAGTSPMRAICIMSFSAACGAGAWPAKVPSSISLLSMGAAADDLDEGWMGGPVGSGVVLSMGGREGR